MDALVARARALLQGETAAGDHLRRDRRRLARDPRAFALGLTHQPGPDFDLILAAVSGAIALLNEAIRLYVVSPATLAAVVAETTPSEQPGHVVVIDVPPEPEPASPPDVEPDPAPAEAG
jgi:hypothetical protein